MASGDSKRFGARLRRAMRARGPLCVGLDPHPALLRSWGLPDDVTGLDRFGRTMVEALADRVAVIKPQSAFYERFGARGIAVLESTIRQFREAGTIVLLDVKRGDIGSTSSPGWSPRSRAAGRSADRVGVELDSAIRPGGQDREAGACRGIHRLRDRSRPRRSRPTVLADIGTDSG